MWMFVLEAGIALSLLVFIVWWTMFSGQKSDDLHREEKSPDDTQS